LTSFSYRTLIESSVEKVAIPEDIKLAALREVYHYLTEYKMFSHIPKKEKRESLPSLVSPSPTDHVSKTFLSLPFSN
jgi:hypothetical protein